MAVPVRTVVDRLPPEHRQRLQTSLSGAVATSLRQMQTAGLLRPTLSDDHAAELITAGYARETSGGLALTDLGAVRGMMETGL